MWFKNLQVYRLTRQFDLTTEQLAKAQVLTAAAKEVLFDRFQGQQIDQIIQQLKQDRYIDITGMDRQNIPPDEQENGFHIRY